MLEKKNFFREYLPYILMLGLFAVYHKGMGLTVDDLYFSEITLDTLIPWLVNRYLTNSSRTVLEFTMIVLLNLPRIIWHVADLCIILLLAVFSVKLVSDGRGKSDVRAARWLVVISILIFQVSEMSTAGWTATTMNYLWTTSTGVFFLWFLWNHMHGKQFPLWMNIPAFLALLLSANLEQPACLLLGFSCCFLVYAVYAKRRGKQMKLGWLFAAMGVALINMLLAMLCPGTDARYADAVAHWFPEYADFHMFYRLRLGIEVTMNDLFYVFHPNSVLFLVVLAGVGWKKAGSWQEKLLAVFPLVMSLWFLLANELDFGAYWMRFSFPLNWRRPEALLGVVIYGVAVLGVLYNIILVFGKQPKTLLMLIIFAAGCCSRIMMGFSPTVYASDRRTGVFLTYAIAFITVSAIMNLREENRRKGMVSGDVSDGVKVAVVLGTFAMVMVNMIQMLWCW